MINIRFSTKIKSMYHHTNSKINYFKVNIKKKFREILILILTNNLRSES